MNRRDALRRMLGGAVALAIAPVGAIRRIAALEPVNYLSGTANISASALARLTHDIYVKHVVQHVRRDSAVAALFSDAEPYRPEGRSMVFSVDLNYTGE